MSRLKLFAYSEEASIRSVVSDCKHIFCLTFVDPQSYFARFSFQRFPEGSLGLTDNVNIIGVAKYMFLLVEYSVVRL
jgi:hypothetical protein